MAISIQAHLGSHRGTITAGGAPREERRAGRAFGLQQVAAGQELAGGKVKLTFAASPAKYSRLPWYSPAERRAFGIVHGIKMKIKTVILGWLVHIYNLSPSFIVKKDNQGDAA